MITASFFAHLRSKIMQYLTLNQSMAVAFFCVVLLLVCIKLGGGSPESFCNYVVYAPCAAGHGLDWLPERPFTHPFQEAPPFSNTYILQLLGS